MLKIKEFKKVIVALLFAISSMLSQFSILVMAETPNETAEINKFDSISEVTNSFPLNKDFSYEYETMVYGEPVKVSVSNKRVNIKRDSNVGEGDFEVQQGQSYIYTLTFSPLYLNTGSFTYNVNYSIGDLIKPYEGVYKINVTSVTLTGIAPSGFSLGNSNAYVTSGNGSIIVETEGNISFERPIFSNLKYNVYVRITSTKNSFINIRHSVTW
ncbi:MAG: hypothetical protein K2K34_02285 [Oscillospiraceae bacterium]|nr:hypothetical protein [Oscillospiraceae bacterium]